MPSAKAQSPFYWDGLNGTNAWNTSNAIGTNWSSSSSALLPTAGLPTAADNVFFYLKGASNLSNILGADFTINQLNFTTNALSPITIGGGNLLTLGAGGLNIQAAAAGATITLNTNVALGGIENWGNTSVNLLTINGILSGAAGNNLTITGTGGFKFSNVNTYAGSTTLATNGSRLDLIGVNGTIQSTSGITLGGGAILNLDSTD
jgi:hypothetical protein